MRSLRNLLRFVQLNIIFFSLAGCGSDNVDIAITPSHTLRLEVTRSPSASLTMDKPTEYILEPSITPSPEARPLIFEELFKTSVSANGDLIASPQYLDAHLPDSSLELGDVVQIIGVDKNSAWLLVLHNNILGWVPTIYASVGVGTLNSTVIPLSNSVSCNHFLDSVGLSTARWENNKRRDIGIDGYMYIPVTATHSGEVQVLFEVEETGQQYVPDITRTVLMGGGEVWVLSSMIEGLDAGVHVRYQLSGVPQWSTPFQAAFYYSDCSIPPGTTSIGGAAGGSLPTMESITLYITSVGGIRMTVTPSVPNTTFDWSSCHASYTTRFWVGARGYVSTTTSLPNRVREMPYTNATVLGRIYPGEKFTVIKGPSCSGGMIWWKIVADKVSSLQGWTAEGNSSGYWLVPIP